MKKKQVLKWFGGGVGLFILWSWWQYFFGSPFWNLAADCLDYLVWL